MSARVRSYSNRSRIAAPQQPTRFRFVLNLKTTSALGIAVAKLILLRADEVIE